jgi:dolichyl-phosphate beta-glucosyltransferase
MSARKPTPIALVVPCYNEASRLPLEYWNTLLELPDFYWIFVDDGSKDATHEILVNLTEQHAHAEVLKLARNSGKGEAVRQGLLHALKIHPNVPVGFVDSDGSFEIFDILRFAHLYNMLESDGQPHAVWASRQHLAGRSTDREPARALISATISSLLHLGNRAMPRDTQCGFKIFPATEQLQTALSTPFTSRWLFDTELYHRLPGQKIWEEPLRSCKHAPGSKVSGLATLRLLLEMPPLALKALRNK